MQRGIDERGLLASWQAGDPDALGALYRRYAPSLRTLCARRLPAEADVEDVVHETFLRAQRAVDTLDAGAPVWPWLATIAARLCTDARRSEDRRLRLERASDQPSVELEEEVAFRLRRAIVGDALHRLNPSHRAAVVLHHLVGWSYKDIAQVQDKSVTAVRSDLLRGRRVLRRRVREVAKARRQWPLPGSVPLVRRFQHLRTTAQAWVVAFESAAFLQSAGAAFLLAVVGFSNGPATPRLSQALDGEHIQAAAHPQPRGPADRRADARAPRTWLPSPAAAPLSAWRRDLVVLEEGPVRRENTPVLKEPRGSIQDRGSDMYIDIWFDVHTPAYEGYGTGTTGNTNCQQPNPVLSAARTVFCTAVRAVIPHLPPDGPIHARGE